MGVVRSRAASVTVSLPRGKNTVTQRRVTVPPSMLKAPVQGNALNMVIAYSRE